MAADLTWDLRHWVNDALMTVFFLVIGLEVIRELTIGRLPGRGRAADRRAGLRRQLPARAVPRPERPPPEKAAAGCKLRVALGDADSEAVRARGAEERFGHGIETRCRVALMHDQPRIGVPGIEVHLPPA